MIAIVMKDSTVINNQWDRVQSQSYDFLKLKYAKMAALAIEVSFKQL